MNRRHVAVAATMIVLGGVGLVVGVVAVASGEAVLVGLAAIGALVAVLGAVFLRDTARAARVPGGSGRRRPDTDDSGHHVYPGPTGDVGSEWHVNRQRDGDSSGGSESVGGTGGDAGGGWSGWSGSDSGSGWSGGGDSGGGGGGGSS
ncbi:hypothetical protein O7614_25535 [Micromonospora sp. WMMD961]|uniref:hypothetical protein n=1 Tax=Micromonospora sp. WMMD961 TaxID=3016100 RepID=UPI0024178CB9|nr:hypothetical protein [Micromonospora sp. WMMD961]MDG4783031.1 hypothetical protein [Micromonospora sp. WMMD961]